MYVHLLEVTKKLADMYEAFMLYILVTGFVYYYTYRTCLLLSNFQQISCQCR